MTTNYYLRIYPVLTPELEQAIRSKEWIQEHINQTLANLVDYVNSNKDILEEEVNQDEVDDFFKTSLIDKIQVPVRYCEYFLYTQYCGDIKIDSLEQGLPNGKYRLRRFDEISTKMIKSKIQYYKSGFEDSQGPALRYCYFNGINEIEELELYFFLN
jgi:hypothetical protein